MLKKIITKLSLFIHLLYTDFYTLRRYLKYSSSFDNINSILTYLIMMIHIIEKGLIIPREQFRLGFGEKHLTEIFFYLDKLFLISCNKPLDTRIDYVFSILKLYLITHKKLNADFKLPCHKEFEKYRYYIDNANLITIPIVKKNEYEKAHELNFAKLCYLRHSIRDFSDERIPIETIYASIKLAQTAPSACNRQNPRIIIIRDKNYISQVMNLQHGGRTFAEKIDTLFIICSDLEGYWYANEQRCSLIDAGLFSMQFVNALLYNGIGSCILHWSVLPNKDKKLRKLINPPKNWEINILIAGGKLQDSTNTCPSIRRNPEDIIMMIN